MKSKILSFDNLRKRIENYQKDNKKVVMCYGMFGVLHIGHIRYLKQAEQYGDVVVVVITPDRYIDSIEKENYESMRAEALVHLDWIDSVAVNNCDDFQEMIRALSPDVFAKGFESVHADDQPNQEDQEEQFLQSMGIQYVIAKEGNFYTTGQINRYLKNSSDNTLNYISLFKQRHSKDDLLRPLEQLQKLSVLVIGDTILDEYYYCSAIGKSSKDPTLALKYEHQDLFAGGILAVANHVANFAGRVDLVTVLGQNDSHEEFILSKLKPNIRPFYVFKPNAPTLIKKRFIDGYSANKLLELYVMNDSYLDSEQDQALCNMFREQLPHYDLVIVADYGHGALSRKMIDVLTRESSFLAVNTQSNAGNRGFNTISKYSKADFVSLAEHEIRLETRDTVGRLFPMMTKLARDVSCRHFVVTRGKKGCILIDKQRSLFQVPSFAQNVVDRVGAGDAFFVMTSMFSALDVPGEIIGFIGNVAGSLAVEIMGNKESIDKHSVTEYINNLFQV